MTTTSITVAFPVEIEGRTIAEVSIRRPKVKDLRTLDQAKGRDAGDIGQDKGDPLVHIDHAQIGV